MMPSVSKKPSASAPRSAGVAISTAWAMPLMTRATGTSVASTRVCGAAPWLAVPEGTAARVVAAVVVLGSGGKGGREGKGASNMGQMIGTSAGAWAGAA